MSTIPNQTFEVNVAIPNIAIGLSSIFSLYLIGSGIGLLVTASKIDSSGSSNRCISEIDKLNMRNILISNVVFIFLMLILLAAYYIPRVKSGLFPKIELAIFGLAIILLLVSLIMGFVMWNKIHLDSTPCLSDGDFKNLQASFLLNILAGAILLFANLFISITNCPSSISLVPKNELQLSPAK